MAAYFIARVDISDREKYGRYLKEAPAIIEKYGGRVIVRSENPVALEGPDEKRRIIVIEFPSLEKIREFYDSPEYRRARTLREGAADGEIIAVDGSA